MEDLVVDVWFTVKIKWDNVMVWVGVYIWNWLELDCWICIIDVASMSGGGGSVIQERQELIIGSPKSVFYTSLYEYINQRSADLYDLSFRWKDICDLHF